MKKYNAIGLMSGTSLDGLDIAACEFTFMDRKWSFRILYSQTYPYSAQWKKKLSSAHRTNALTFSMINKDYGHLLGRLTNSFLEKTGFIPDFIASHGHTVFHQPDRGLTVQIGSGSAIAAETGYPVICDFRSLDVALGGQGAPLVPVGDRLLFHEFDACLNLGGFANISMEKNGSRIAFDICPANIILNKVSSRLGLDYDKDGQIARTGTIVPQLLEQLNTLDYYQLGYPKSLGREWLDHDFLPVIGIYNFPENDLLRTICEHIACQVNKSLNQPAKSLKILVSGGGTHNTFLLELLKKNNNHNWMVLSDVISDFKEALIFAFLGTLRWTGKSNVLASVTGSKKNHPGGSIYRPA